jgi:hypothetical protein
MECWKLLLETGSSFKKFRKRNIAFFYPNFFPHCNFFQIFVTKNQNPQFSKMSVDHLIWIRNRAEKSKNPVHIKYIM